MHWPEQMSFTNSDCKATHLGFFSSCLEWIAGVLKSKPAVNPGLGECAFTKQYERSQQYEFN